MLPGFRPVTVAGSPQLQGKISPYSLSKYVNKLTCGSFSRAYGITTAAFRFGGIRQAIKKEVMQLHGAYTLGAADTRCPERTMEIQERFELAKSLTAPLPGRSPLLSIEQARRSFGYEPIYRLLPID